MRSVFAVLAVLSLVRSASGFVVIIDYSLDTAGFFSTNTTARNALEAAATDISNAITSTYTAISPSNMVFNGVNGGTTATVDWKAVITHPSSGASHDLTSVSSNAGEFRIFVGMRSLAGTTLGQGGPAGAGFSLGGSGFEAEWTGAVGAMQTASNLVMDRGPGPRIGTITGNATFGAANPAYTLHYGLLAGNLWFDDDADNNGSADGDLSTYWHFNHTTGVGGGLNDFYTVALHEILHTVGFGASLTWDSKISGANWTGTEAITTNGGSGVGLVDTGSNAHLAGGTMSTTIIGSLAQEAVMTPSLTTGTRRTLTQIDLAVLRDLGFTTTAIPEPSTYVLLFGVAALGLAICRRRKAT
jgi:hypothetical protein